MNETPEDRAYLDHVQQHCHPPDEHTPPMVEVDVYTVPTGESTELAERLADVEAERAELRRRVVWLRVEMSEIAARLRAVLAESDDR